jgi:hypothetical protein
VPTPNKQAHNPVGSHIPESQLIFERRGTVTEVEIYSNPAKASLEILMRRKIERMAESIDFEQQLPAWLRFAKARQGEE